MNREERRAHQKNARRPPPGEFGDGPTIGSIGMRLTEAPDGRAVLEYFWDIPLDYIEEACEHLHCMQEEMRAAVSADSEPFHGVVAQ